MKHGVWIVFSIIHFLLNISLLTAASNGTPMPTATPTGMGGILAGIIIVLVLILVAAVWIIILKYKSTK